MSIEEAIFKLLTTDANVAAIVAQRVYPLEMPQGSALPAITYMVASGLPIHSMSGDSGVAVVSFQVDMWAAQYNDVVDLHKRVKKAVDMFDGTVAGVEIQCIAVTNWMDVNDPEPQEPKVYHRSIDIDVDYVINDL